MKIRLISDLHLDYGNFIPGFYGEEVLVIAGDISNDIKDSMLLIREYINKNDKVDVVFVLGNHDYYRNTINDTIKKWLELDLNRFHFLSSSSVVLRGYRFCGATLWTDMNNRNDKDMEVANLTMRDYNCINGYQYNTKLTPSDTVNLHEQQLLYLMKEVDDSKEPCIIVTHHLPSYKSVAEKYKSSSNNASYSSDLDYFVAHVNIDYWFHGHTHNSCDYMIENTKVVCNPKGYGDENDSGFQIGLIIETK
jgi:Icc-related predicted phosphoesterase